MRQLRAFWVRLLGTLRRGQHEDFAEELESHIAMDTERGIRQGLSPEEARRQAMMRLGGMAQVRNAHGERRGLPWLESLLRDFHYSGRALIRNRAVTLIAILSIGLGIGSNATIFSMVSRFVLRPPPVGDPGSLLSLISSRMEIAAAISFRGPWSRICAGRRPYSAEWQRITI